MKVCGILKSSIKLFTLANPLLHPWQIRPLLFVYQASKGVEDTKLFIPDCIHTSRNLHVMLCYFQIFPSFAFNTMQPHISFGLIFFSLKCCIANIATLDFLRSTFIVVSVF